MQIMYRKMDVHPDSHISGKFTQPLRYKYVIFCVIDQFGDPLRKTHFIYLRLVWNIIIHWSFNVVRKHINFNFVTFRACSLDKMKC
jgi:hypothetical protein